MSVFNPETFLDATTDQPNEKRALIPVHNPDTADGLYQAVIGEIKTDSGTIGKGDNIGKPWISMVVPLKLQLGSQVQALGLSPEFTVTDRVFLDLNASGDGLDNSKGKNNAQRIYRDATGLNVKGEKFAWRMMASKVVKVQLVHEEYPVGSGNYLEKPKQILPS